MPRTVADASLEAYAAAIAPADEVAEVAPRTRLSFEEYIRRVLPSFPFHFPHLRRIIARLQDVADGKTRRLIIVCPPRHWKTTTVTRLFSSYYLLRFPARWVAITAYDQDLAHGFSRDARDFYTSYGGELVGDTKAVKRWTTGDGGGLWAAGIRGPAGGKGFHLGVVDDPLKNLEEAESAKIRRRNRLWYESVWEMRREPGNAEIIVTTRWPPRDLITDLAERSPEPYHVVHFDALHEDPDELRRAAAAKGHELEEWPDHWTVEEDWREPGEALCPAIRDAEELRRLRDSILPYVWHATMQGRPRPEEGTTIKRAWFQYVDVAPAGGEVVRFWDYGASEDGDPTASAKVKRVGDRYYVLDATSEWLGTAEVDEWILETDRGDATEHDDVRFVREQEPGASGRRDAEWYVRQHAGLSAEFRPASASQRARIRPFASQLRAKNVWLVRGLWCGKFVDQCCAYPFGDHDDMLIAAAGAFMELAVPEEKPEPVAVVWT